MIRGIFLCIMLPSSAMQRKNPAEDVHETNVHDAFLACMRGGSKRDADIAHQKLCGPSIFIKAPITCMWLWECVQGRAVKR